MRLDSIEASGEEMVFGLWSLAILAIKLDFKYHLLKVRIITTWTEAIITD